MTPQTIGRYQIVAELGRGAMGTVYHGIDSTIERPVALKILNPDLPNEVLDEVKGRFLREAKSAGRLNHPNIVTIYEFGEANGTAFLAMEFLEGKSLHQVMRGERLPYATIAALIAQIADGLDYAHRAGVVHRDIKPANIMVSPHGVAKLTDFGIAHLQSSQMTNAGTMLGSPKYMAPEYVLGKPIDGRADVFSLGIVLYEMLAQRTPFEDGDTSTIFSLMQRIVTEAAQPLANISPEVPAAFDLILTRALAKDPAARYQSAGQFANELRNYKFLMQANGTPQGDITAIVNRPAYAEPHTEPRTPITAATASPSPAPSPAPAPAATPVETSAAAPAPEGGSSAWERAAAFLGRKTSFAPAITPPAAASINPAPAAAPATAPAAGNAVARPAAAPVATAAPAPINAPATPAPRLNPAPAATITPPHAMQVAPQVAPQAPAPAATPQAAAEPSRFAAARQKSANADEPLLGDLDALSSSLDEMQRRFVEEEANAMAALRKGQSSAKDWDNITSGIGELRPEAPLAGENAGGPSAGNAARKSGVFGLLRQQAAPDLKSQATAKRDAEAEAMLAFDARLRAGYDFLLEFCRELNDATPLFAGKHELLFYGPCPPLMFSEATANARFNRVDDRGRIRDVLDHMLLSYYLKSPDNGRNTVTPVELPGFKALLEQHEMKHDVQEVKNDFGQIIRANFKFEFKFICSLTLRANYTENNIEVTCRNIGPLGRARYVAPVEALEIAFFEELSKLMLGFPNEMARYAAEG